MIQRSGYQSVSPLAPRVFPAYRNLFSGLMQVYEANYSLLKRLLGGNHIRNECMVYCPNSRYHLRFVSRECGHHTMTMVLAYSLLDGQLRPLVNLVQLQIRLYHDTCQAELLQLPGPAGTHRTGKSALEAKWVANRFLNSVLLELTTFTGGK